MIGGFRKFAKSKWSALLFGLLILSFGIFGFQDPFRGITGGGFIKIGDREIHSRDVTKELTDRIEEIRVKEDKILSQEEAVKAGLGNQALFSLEYQTYLSAYADAKGIRASTLAVENALLRDSNVFKDALGRVNIDAIRQQAKQQGMKSVKQYEEYVRDVLTRIYVEKAAFEALKVPDVLSVPVINYAGETRTFTIARLGPGTVAKPSEPTDAQLETWYNNHKDAFSNPERRRISVLSYSPEDFIDRVELTDEQVKAEYQKRIKDYSTPETREISEFSSADRAAVQAFVDLAKQGVTIDEALKRTPNVTRKDLTVKPADVTHEQYRELVFALPAGQVNGNPSRLDDNSPWFTVVVNKITPGVAEPFEKIADKVRHDVALPDAERMYEDESEKFRDAAGGQPLEDIGKQFGFPVIMLPPVDKQARTAKGEPTQLLAGNPALQELFTMQAGQMTNLFEGDKQRAMYRLDEIVPPSTTPFADVKGRVHDLYLIEEVQNQATKAANDMAAAVKGGKAFDQAAAGAKMVMQPVLTTSRMSPPQGIDPTVLQSAFDLKLGEVGVVTARNREPWVVRVDKIEPVTAEAKAILRAQIGPQVAQTLQRDMQEVFIGGLQKEIPITRDEAAIKQYFDGFTKNDQ